MCQALCWVLGMWVSKTSPSLCDNRASFLEETYWVRNYRVQFSHSVVSNSVTPMDCSTPDHTHKCLSDYSGVRCYQRKFAQIMIDSYWYGVLKKITGWLVHLVVVFTPGPYTHPGDNISMSFRGYGIFAKGKVQIMGLDEMGFEVSIRKEPGNKG